MGVFNFMETFFFLSLGITFVLILLLVYHFKQRLATVEAKSDTMFDIMNTMVKEMGVIKAMASRSLSMPPPFFQGGIANPAGPVPTNQGFSQFGQVVPATMNAQDHIHITSLGEHIQSISEDDVSADHDECSDDEDTDEEGEEGSYEEDSDEEGSDDEVVEPTDAGVQEPLSTDLGQSFTRIVVSDTEEAATLVEEVLVVEEPTKPLSVEPTEVELSTVAESKTEAGDADDVSVISELSLDNTLDTQSKTTNYRKMNLGELKQVVLTKGLVQDVGKLKKKELLELLSSTVA